MYIFTDLKHPSFFRKVSYYCKCTSTLLNSRLHCYVHLYLQSTMQNAFYYERLKKKFKMSDWTEKENLFFLHNIDLYWQYSYQLRYKFQESIYYFEISSAVKNWPFKLIYGCTMSFSWWEITGRNQNRK